MSIEVTYIFSIEVKETLQTSVPALAGQTLLYNAFKNNAKLTASTTPPVTKKSLQNISLVAGAKTIDLTSLTDTNGITIDGTGLKVQLIKIKNNGASNMTFNAGASNGYNLLGSAWKVILTPGQIFMSYLDDDSPDIGGSAKNIDVTGTGTEQFSLEVVMG